MSDNVTTTIGFIGLGRMGLPMAARMVTAGHTVYGYDVAEMARQRLAQVGGKPVSDLAEVAAAHTIILMLPDSAAVSAVLHDAALESKLRPGTTVIDMSSSEPMETRKLAEEVARRGMRLLDAPVSGGVKGAEAGKLTIMIGVPEAEYADLAVLLAPLGRMVRAGDVGAGHAVKALNNLLSAAHLLATSEAIRVGQRFGLDPKVMLDIFNTSSGRSGSTENKWPNFIISEKYDSGFALRLMVKDMKIAVDLGNDLGVSMALGEAARALWQDAADTLPATADHTHIATWPGPGDNRARGKLK
ncbi:MAG TPA: NAD(P)-dependent oxidoreductase [Magnetospirillaceae bacterium]